MLYAGLDLSRKRLDFRLLDQAGETVEIGAAPPDADGLRALAVQAVQLAQHGELPTSFLSHETVEVPGARSDSCRQAMSWPSLSCRSQLA
jgi:hypothetical protein